MTQPDARTRAILWCLHDLDPQMPLVLALGYLKVVEQRLDMAQANAEKRERQAEAWRKKHGAARTEDIPELLQDLAAHPPAVAMASVPGNKGKLKSYIRDMTGCSHAVASDAAESMVNLYLT